MDGRELIGMRGYTNNSLTPSYPPAMEGLFIQNIPGDEVSIVA